MHGTDRDRPVLNLPGENLMNHPYRNLAIQTIISGVVMYLVMLMILAMRHMFPSKRANAALLAGSAVIFSLAVSFLSEPRRRSATARSCAR